MVYFGVNGWSPWVVIVRMRQRRGLQPSDCKVPSATIHSVVRHLGRERCRTPARANQKALSLRPVVAVDRVATAAELDFARFIGQALERGGKIPALTWGALTVIFH